MVCNDSRGWFVCTFECEPGKKKENQEKKRGVKTENRILKNRENKRRSVKRKAFVMFADPLSQTIQWSTFRGRYIDITIKGTKHLRIKCCYKRVEC